MNNKTYEQFTILVTYASRSGSTMGVAEAIGHTLSEKNFKVDILSMNKVDDITQYDVIIAGSAIQNRQWLPEAMQFLDNNLTTINQKPFATFSVCMTLAMPDAEKYRQGVIGWLEPVRSKTKPFSEGFFAGTLDLDKIPSFPDRFKFRISVLLGVWAAGDHRDWEAIRIWTENLIPAFEDINTKLIPENKSLHH
jgi:menaquinone-dependent protoporphyrinogen oxidase